MIALRSSPCLCTSVVFAATPAPTLTPYPAPRSFGPSAHRAFVGNVSQSIHRSSARDSHVRTLPARFAVEVGEGSYVLHATAAAGKPALLLL